MSEKAGQPLEVSIAYHTPSISMLLTLDTALSSPATISKI
jgi:hypothetical protein